MSVKPVRVQALRRHVACGCWQEIGDVYETLPYSAAKTIERGLVKKAPPAKKKASSSSASAAASSE